MAEILPFKAWRYNKDLSGQIEDLTSPLFDVVSERQRDKLYQNPFNSIHLSVPSGPIPTKSAKLLLETWKKSGILELDPIPGIYVYYQYYSLPGSSETVCRKGFMCHIKIHEFDEGVILRHENTIPAAVNDRIALLESTELHASATHGLYVDPTFVLEKYMDEAVKVPIYETEDYQGVRDVLAVIQDARVIRLFMDTLKDKQVILADGHHRYEGSLQLKRKMQKQFPAATGEEPWNYHLMYLTNTENSGFSILPTHRLIHDMEVPDPDTFVKQIEPWFTYRWVEDTQDIPEIIHGKDWAFGVIFPDKTLKIKLKEDKWRDISWKFPDVVKQLDLTVLHYFILEKVLGIPGADQRMATQLSFERNFTQCMTKVIGGKAKMALITNEITINQVVQVCQSGFTLPQKSTYFFPKVISGFLFSSIHHDEFTFSTDPCLGVAPQA
jgi:uncharacterized protein (DUF1015 family)